MNVRGDRNTEAPSTQSRCAEMLAADWPRRRRLLGDIQNLRRWASHSSEAQDAPPVEVHTCSRSRLTPSPRRASRAPPPTRAAFAARAPRARRPRAASEALASAGASRWAPRRRPDAPSAPPPPKVRLRDASHPHAASPPRKNARPAGIPPRARAAPDPHPRAAPSRARQVPPSDGRCPRTDPEIDRSPPPPPPLALTPPIRIPEMKRNIRSQTRRWTLDTKRPPRPARCSPA